MDADSSFGRVLTTHRKRIGMSRSELANAAQLSYPYVSQLETGLRKPSRKSAAALAAALGLDPLDLEAAIPADETDPRLQRRASLAQVALMGEPPDAGSPSFEDRVERISRRSAPSTRDELVGQLLDLLEELEPGDRLDALAEVQRRAMQRIVDEQTLRRS